MIYTVTFNPSLDYIVEVTDFKLGMTNRTSYEHMLPGGKGINVSIVLNNLEIDELFAVGMLQEGVTLSSLDECLIIQLDGNERGFIQKAGRTMRTVNPVIHIIVIDGTQDDNYLKNVIENIEEKYIVHIWNL